MNNKQTKSQVIFIFEINFTNNYLITKTKFTTDYMKMFIIAIHICYMFTINTFSITWKHIYTFTNRRRHYENISLITLSCH